MIGYEHELRDDNSSFDDANKHTRLLSARCSPGSTLERQFHVVGSNKSNGGGQAEEKACLRAGSVTGSETARSLQTKERWNSQRVYFHIVALID